MKNFKNQFRSPILIRLVIDVLLSIAALCGYARFSMDKPSDEATRLLWIFLAVYLLAVVAVEVVFHITDKVSYKEMNESVRPQLGKVNLDFIIKLRQPVVITDVKGNVIWFNKHLEGLYGKSAPLLGASFDKLVGHSLKSVYENSEDGTVFSVNDRHFLLRTTDVQLRNKHCLVTTFEDRTDLETAIREKADATVLVAYILIDNLGELTAASQNQSRTAATSVVAELESLAESVNGILKEYERDRFLLLFDQKYLNGLIESRFDILDRVREIRIGESSLPVTISIGISRASGTPAQRAAASATCLDMALGRGGDQVVLRNEDGTLDFFGGKTKTVQKRTRVRARMMALNLLAEISASSNVIIMMHRFPDFDAIGAAFGVLRICCFCGVKANIVVNMQDDTFKRCYERVKHLPDYTDERLFVAPSDAQTLIGPDTLLVIVDVSNRAQFEVPELADMVRGEKTVFVDHHRKVAEFEEKPSIEYIEPSASSTCELITEMIEQTMQPGILQKEEADIMYAGITLDTKQFVRNTGVRTFSAALFLRGEGAIPSDSQTLFKTDIDDFLSEARFETGVTLYRNHFALAINENPDAPEDRISAAKAADKLLTVEGIKASFALCRLGENVHISARSAGEINVQLIMESLGGGGHFDASATMLNDTSIEKATELLKQAIDQHIAQ